METKGTGTLITGQARENTDGDFMELSARIPGVVYQFKIDATGNYSFTFISESIQSFLGLSAVELCANPDIGFNNIHREDINAVVKGGYLSSKTLQQHAFTFRAKDVNTGLYKWVKASSQPIRNAAGAVTWNGIMVDVTLDKENEEKRIADAHEINKELESFNYSVSHDLQNPIRSILGFSKILLNDYKDELNAEALDYVKIIDFKAQHMSNLTKDLLSLSRLGSGAINYSEVNMNRQLEHAIEQLMPDEWHKVEIIKAPLAKAFCDANLMQQVWLNLLANAFKYSAKKEKPVVETGLISGDNELIYFVKDNGVGFDMQYYNRLFAPFQRIHSSEEFEGSGIGLAIVHRIITKHGGRVWAEAKPGDGACFYFSLPVLKDLFKKR